MSTLVNICPLLIREEALLTGFQRQRAFINIHKDLTLLEENIYKCQEADQYPYQNEKIFLTIIFHFNAFFYSPSQ